MKKIYVADTTLCDLCEGDRKNLSFRERLNMALGLEKAGVDAIELPGLNGAKEDAVICRTIAGSVNCKVCVPGGSTAEAVAEAWNCVSAAKNPAIQIVLPVSTVQMEYLYHLKADKMIDKIAALCQAAKAVCENVEFVARDASRAEAGFAARCCQIAAENGAAAVTLCDDSGSFFPQETAALVKEVKACCDAKVYVQPSDSLKMAAACAVAALEAGADGIKTGSAGLNCDVLADVLRAKGDSLEACADLDITAVHNIMAKLGQSAAPVVTAPAVTGSDELTLDAESTLADITDAVGSLGYELSEEDLGKVYEEFRRVSRRKAKLDAKELEAIIATTAMQVPSTFHLTSYVVNSGNIITATAHVTLEKNGQSYSGVSTGDGPIDAAFHAIEQIIGHHYELDDFQIQSLTKGREAVGSSLIRLRAGGKLYSGNGISTDIVGACIRAYINALNKIVYEG